MNEVADRKVRMRPELMERWATRDAEGRRLSWSWGEPDEEGFYTPWVTAHEDDRLGDLDAAWAEAEATERARIRAAVDGLRDLDKLSPMEQRVWAEACAAVLAAIEGADHE